MLVMGKKKKGVSSIGVAIASAAIGAVAAVLANEKNRKIIEKTVSNVVDEGEKRVDKARQYIKKVGAKNKPQKALKAKVKEEK